MVTKIRVEGTAKDLREAEEVPVWKFPPNAAKAHAFDGATSLCGRWMFTGEKERNQTTPPERPGTSDCKACWKKMRALLDRRNA
jgi:hypothetical protein